MTEYCKFHPTRPAHFHCKTCDHYFCGSCISKRQRGDFKGDNIYLCPSCKVEADWIAATNAVKPFWNRLHKIFMYPLALHPMVLMCGVALLTTVFSGTDRFSVTIRLAFMMLMLKYSFATLRATASGSLKPPRITIELFTGDIGPVIKQGAVFLMFGVILGIIGVWAGFLPAGVFLLFCAFCLPAMIIILAGTNSFFMAINPAIFVPMIIRIGWGYAVMYLFYILIAGAPTFLAQVFLQHLPMGLGKFLTNFAEFFYSIVAYHLMGYMMLQYNQEVGYTVNIDDFEDPSQEPVPEESSGIMGEVGYLVKEGKLEEALDRIHVYETEHGITDAALSRNYFKLLKMKQKIPELLNHAPVHLYLLTKENQKIEACEVFSECLQHDKNFSPAAIVLFKLGGWLTENNKVKESLNAYSRLIKQHPDDNLVPKAYFRLAQIYQDKLMDRGKSKQVFSVMQQKFPDHDIIPQAQRYFEVAG